MLGIEGKNIRRRNRLLRPQRHLKAEMEKAGAEDQLLRETLILEIAFNSNQDPEADRVVNQCWTCIRKRLGVGDNLRTFPIHRFLY